MSNTWYRLLDRIGARVWPGLADLGGRDRLRGQVDVLGTLYSLPLAAGGVALLMASTERDIMRLALPMLGVLALLVVFDRLPFFQLAERGTGRYSANSSSLSGLVQVSALLLIGPAAIWPAMLAALLFYARAYHRRRRLPSWRWSIVRNAVFDLAVLTCGSLVCLGVYRLLGGALPIGALAPLSLGAAAGLVLSYLAVAWLVGLGYALLQQVAGLIPTYTYWMRMWIPLTAMETVPRTFGILAAIIFSQLGFYAYAFLIAAVLIVAWLAHRLSQAVERGWQRTRELAQLEQLGREIIAAPPEHDNLAGLLERFVPDMFVYQQIEIRLHDDTTLLRVPASEAPLRDELWSWLGANPAPLFLAAGELEAWSGRPAPHATAMAPIRDAATAEPFGGMCLVISDAVAEPSGTLPALEALGSQIAAARNRTAGYAQMLANQRVSQELAMAWQIQASFLPTTLPQPPGWQLSATLLPARQTSGDFYDIVELPTGQLGLLIADVTDKGMGAALFMALSRTLIRTFALDYPAQPERALAAANQRMLAESIGTGMFVTLFYGVLDPLTGRLVYANAGHNPPLLVCADAGCPPQLLGNTGVPLGVLEDAAWAARSVELQPGDRLVLYTDGITEAQNSGHELFSAERLIATVRAGADRCALDVQTAILDAVQAFAGHEPQFDDMTIMVLLREASQAEHKDANSTG